MIKLCSKMPGRKYTLINKQTKTLFYFAEFVRPLTRLLPHVTQTGSEVGLYNAGRNNKTCLYMSALSRVPVYILAQSESEP